jgi:hypothetical protein
MAIDATKLRRGVRRLGEPPTDSNPELSPPAAAAPAPQSGPDPAPTGPSLPAAPAAGGGFSGAGRYVDGRSRRRTGRIEQINVKVSARFNAELRWLADRENILIVETLERALGAYVRLAAIAEASGRTVEQVLDSLQQSSAS